MADSIEIIIYDFDHTLYDGDCSLDFYFFCIRKKPTILKYLPGQVLHALFFIAGKESRTEFKEHFFVFLRSLSDTEEDVRNFWEAHRHKLKAWYRHTDHKKGVIISASPEFLVKPMQTAIDAIEVIATTMDPSTGLITGLNCRGPEKVIRFRRLFPSAVIKEAYSDSMIDFPILSLAEHPFIVSKETVREVTLPKS